MTNFGKPPDPRALMFWSSVSALVFLILLKVIY